MKATPILLAVVLLTHNTCGQVPFLGNLMTNINRMTRDLQAMGDNLALQGRVMADRMTFQGEQLGRRLRLQGEEIARQAREEAKQREEWARSFGPGGHEFNTTDGGTGFVYNSPDGSFSSIMMAGGSGHGYMYHMTPTGTTVRRW